jgi:hypothetical protein
MMAESNIGLRLCGRCSHVLTDRSAAWDYTETRTEQNKSNKKLDRSFSYSDATPTATTNTQTINHNTSTYDNNKEANIAAHSIHRMDKIKWFDPISNNNNIEITSNNNYITADKTEATSTATATSTTTTINYNSSTYNDNKEANIAHSIHRTDKIIKWFDSISNSNNNNNNNESVSTTYLAGALYPSSNTSTTNNKDNEETSHLSFTLKLISLYLIIIKSFSSKEFKTALTEKHHHHQQQQQHYHGKRRHQFHLEQQQKHQHFKQEQHNMERMVTSIVLKLTLVAWDIWTYRNGF